MDTYRSILTLNHTKYQNLFLLSIRRNGRSEVTLHRPIGIKAYKKITRLFDTILSVLLPPKIKPSANQQTQCFLLRYDNFRKHRYDDRFMFCFNWFFQVILVRRKISNPRRTCSVHRVSSFHRFRRRTSLVSQTNIMRRTAAGAATPKNRKRYTWMSKDRFLFLYFYFLSILVFF